MNPKLMEQQPLVTSFKIDNHSTRVEPNIQTLQMEIPELLMPKVFNTKASPTVCSQIEDEIEINQKTIEELKMENWKLKVMNKELRKKLEEFQKRLDESLKKNKNEEFQKLKLSQEDLVSKQLKNAYKMCDIYKREISQLKKKQGFNHQSKIQELINIIKYLEKQKEKLMQEIKDLKKMSKQQEKGFKQTMNSNVIRLMNQNEKLKQQLRKFQHRVPYSEENRKGHSNSQIITYQCKKEKAQYNNCQLIRIFKQNEGQKQLPQIESTNSRSPKESRKISILINENSMLRQNVDELKTQVIQKDREFERLREKFRNLSNKQSRTPSPMKKRIVTQPQLIIPHKKSNRNIRDLVRKRKQYTDIGHKKIKSQLNTIQVSQKVSKEKLKSQIKNSRVTSMQKYPKILVVGEKDDDTLKWNHINFSSKVKQVQVVPHEQGHIKEVSFRYQKGEPKISIKNPYLSFCCQQASGQYVTCIKGGFKTGLLRYLIVETNKGKKSNFCQVILRNDCINFQFRAKEHEYLGAFFGQNSSEGVTRIGCYVEHEK